MRILRGQQDHGGAGKPEKHAPGIAHENAGGVEVVGDETEHGAEECERQNDARSIEVDVE